MLILEAYLQWLAGGFRLEVMRLVFPLLIISLLLLTGLTALYPPPARAELSCSIDSGTINDRSVTYLLTVSEAGKYSDVHVFLNYDGEGPIEGVKGPPGPDPINPEAAIVPITFDNLPHDPREYRLQADNPELSSATSQVPCDGASRTDTGEVDVHPGGGTTDGPSAPDPDPVVEPEEPKDPCEGKTGADKTSCEEEKECDTDANREEGRVFARAFNNACVTLPEFINTLVNYAMMFASIVAGFMFLQGGIKIIASRGNPAAVVEARSTLINAGVGLVLLATAYVVITFLSDAFGYGVTEDINLLGPFVP